MILNHMIDISKSVTFLMFIYWTDGYLLKCHGLLFFVEKGIPRNTTTMKKEKNKQTNKQNCLRICMWSKYKL